MNWFIDGFIFCLGSISLFIGFLGFLYCAHNPMSEIFIGQLIPKNYYTFIPYGIIVAIFHGYLIFVIQLSTCAAIGGTIPYLFYLIYFVTVDINLGSRKQYRTIAT